MRSRVRVNGSNEKCLHARLVIGPRIVAIKPRIGAYVVCAWLVGIVINLLIIPGFFDIALRDFGLALGALALGRLSQEFSS